MDGVDDEERAGGGLAPGDEPTVSHASGELPPTEEGPFTGDQPPDEASAPGQPEQRRLYREPEEKKLTGVCGGVADYLGVDPTIVRLAVVVLTLATSAAIVAYLVAAVVMPARPAAVPRVKTTRQILPSSMTPHVAFALLIGAVVLLGVDDRWWFDAPVIGLGLVGLGVWLLLHRRDDPQWGWWPASVDQNDIYGENPNAGSDAGTTLHLEVAPERAHAGPPASEDTLGTTGDKTEDEPQPVPVPPEPSSSVPDDSAYRAGPQGEVPPPVPPWGLGTPASPDPQPPSSNGGSPLALIGFLLVVTGIGALFAVLDVVDVSAGTALAIVLVALGLGLVVGAWRGHARALVWLGLPIACLLLIADAADFPLSAGTDDRIVRIDDRADFDSEHELLAGKLLLDLRDLPPSATGDDIPRLTAEVFVGELTVLLPPDATADVHALAGVGNIKGPNEQEEDGIHVERDFVVENGEGATQVQLVLRIGLGDIEVRRG